MQRLRDICFFRFVLCCLFCVVLFVLFVLFVGLFCFINQMPGNNEWVVLFVCFVLFCFTIKCQATMSGLETHDTLDNTPFGRGTWSQDCYFINPNLILKM